MGMVFDRYPSGGGELLLALALADHARDDGTKIYPAVQSLVRKTRQDRRTVQRQLRGMESERWLLLVAHEDGGRGCAREYCINPEWIKGGVDAALSVPGADDAKSGASAALSTPVADEVKGGSSAALSSDQKGGKLPPFPDSQRATPVRERAALDTEKGGYHAAPSVKNHQEPSGGTRAGARDAPLDVGAANNELDVVPFPITWQPCATTLEMLRMRCMPTPEPWVVNGFVGYMADRHLRASQIPGEFLRWAARQRGFQASDRKPGTVSNGHGQGNSHQVVDGQCAFVASFGERCPLRGVSADGPPSPSAKWYCPHHPRGTPSAQGDEAVRSAIAARRAAA